MATSSSTCYEVLKIFGRGIQLVGKSSQVFGLQAIILKADKRHGTFLKAEHGATANILGILGFHSTFESQTGVYVRISVSVSSLTATSLISTHAFYLSKTLGRGLVEYNKTKQRVITLSKVMTPKMVNSFISPADQPRTCSQLLAEVECNMTASLTALIEHPKCSSHDWHPS